MSALHLWANLDKLGFALTRLLLAVLWQSSILFVAIALVVWMLRRRRASIQHALWVLALVIGPLIPLATMAVAHLGAPQAPVPILPAYVEPVLHTPLPPPSPTVDTPTYVPPAVPAPLKAPESPPTFNYPWALGLLGYGAVCGGFLVWIGLARSRIRKWVRFGTVSTDERVLSALAEARKALHVGRELLVMESRQVPVPLTVGTFHPVILLPAGLAERLTCEDLRATILHETAHVRRCDPCILSLLPFIRAVFFFHPLVWLVCRQIVALAERACDDVVLDAALEPVSYARMLVQMAENLPKRSLSTELAAGIVLSKSSFLARVEAILSENRDRIRKLTKLTLAGTLIAAVLSLALALVLPLAEKPPAPDESNLLAVAGDTQPPGKSEAAVETIQSKLDDTNEEDAPTRNASRDTLKAQAKRHDAFWEAHAKAVRSLEAQFMRYHNTRPARQHWTRIDVERDWFRGTVLSPRTEEAADEEIFEDEYGFSSKYSWYSTRMSDGTRRVHLSSPESPDMSRETLLWNVGYPSLRLTFLPLHRVLKQDGDDFRMSLKSCSRSSLIEDAEHVVYQMQFGEDTSGELEYHADLSDGTRVYLTELRVNGRLVKRVRNDSFKRHEGIWVAYESQQDSFRSDRETIPSNSTRIVLQYIAFNRDYEERDFEPAPKEGDLVVDAIEGIRYRYEVRQTPTGAGTDQPAAKGEEAGWGEALQGVQCQLRADKKAWAAGEVPTFTANVRNVGDRPLFIVRGQQTCKLELDGTWFEQKEVAAMVSPFSPGQQYDDMPIALDDRWVTPRDDERLRLEPGRHTVRVAFLAYPEVNIASGGIVLAEDVEPVRPVSNPVEIEILPATGEQAAPVSLAFRLVLERPGPDTDRVPDPQHPDKTMYVYRKVGLDETAVASARLVQPGEGDTWGIELTLTTVGADALEKLTGENIGRRLAIFFDGRCHSAPVIKSRIRGTILIGLLTAEEAEHIAQGLKQLPAKDQVMRNPNRYDIHGAVVQSNMETCLESLMTKLEAAASVEECERILTGETMQPSKLPVPDAVITLQGDSVTRNTVTDAEGEFQFISLPRGEYELSAERPLRFARTGDARLAAARKRVKLDKDTSVNVELCADLLAVRGRITDADGRSIAGANVTTMYDDPTVDSGEVWRRHALWVFSATRSTLSDADGFYELHGLEPTDNFYRIAGYLVTGSRGALRYVNLRVEADGFVQSKEDVPRVPLVTEEGLYWGRRFIRAFARFSKEDHPEKQGILPSIEGNTITGIDVVLKYLVTPPN